MHQEWRGKHADVEKKDKTSGYPCMSARPVSTPWGTTGSYGMSYSHGLTLGVCDNGVDATSFSYICTENISWLKEEKNMDWRFFLDWEDALLFSCGGSVESDYVTWFAYLAHDRQMVNPITCQVHFESVHLPNCFKKQLPGWSCLTNDLVQSGFLLLYRPYWKKLISTWLFCLDSIWQTWKCHDSD